MIYIQARSAGFTAGNYASIILNNTSVKMERNEHNHYRGLHVVIISPKNGQVLFAKIFDTYKSSDSFWTFLNQNQIQDGSFVIAAC